MNQDLQRVDQWLADNRMIPKVKKTKSVVIGYKMNVIPNKKCNMHSLFGITFILHLLKLSAGKGLW